MLITILAILCQSFLHHIHILCQLQKRSRRVYASIFFFRLRLRESGHLSGGNTSSTCRMQMTKYVYMMCAVMQIIPFSCWENLLNLVLDMWKKALKHSSSNRRNFKHFKHDETDWFLAGCSFILWTQTKHLKNTQLVRPIFFIARLSLGELFPL